MHHSQYCLGKLQGQSFEVSKRAILCFDREKFEKILDSIHKHTPEELSEILMARRFYLFERSSKARYSKFLRWVLRQEAGKLSNEQLYVFEKLMKKGNSHSLRHEEYGLVRDVIGKYYPTTDCPDCNTDHTASGQCELYPLHYSLSPRGDCFWHGATPHIWQDPKLKHIFENQ